jgi:hypothetical protein
MARFQGLLEYCGEKGPLLAKPTPSVEVRFLALRARSSARF